MYYDDEENNTRSGMDNTANENTEVPADPSVQNTNTDAIPEENNENPYETLNERDYKENIKRMKQEYKQFQKDKKKNEKAEYASYNATQQNNSSYKQGIGAGTSLILSLLTSFIVFVIIFGLLAFFPTKDKSFLASLNTEGNKSSSGQTKNPSGDDVQIGGDTISKGDNVTINVNGESEITKAVYAKAVNSVVGIEVIQISGSKWNQTERTVSMGSGIVYSTDGIIATNCHVVQFAINGSTGKMDDNYTIKVYFKTDLSEWAYVTELIGFDAANDLAVLRVDAKNLQPIEFADSDTLTTGETAIALGSPGGLSYMNSISEGILSGVNRAIKTSSGETIYDLIQTTAAINPGNSGGALLNKEGKLIGICVIKIASTDYESMGFAINSNTVKTIVESIIEYGYYNKPLLGITINPNYTTTVADKQGWKRGAYIQALSNNSASGAAGIKADDIITKINDTQISSYTELRRFLLKCKPGDKVSVEVYRFTNTETLNFEVTLNETAKPY